MAKYSTLILLVLTLLNFANAQTDELPLAFSETYEYLHQGNEELKKTTLTDLTGDKPVEIIIWTTKTVTNGSERTQKLGIVDGDTLTDIAIRQFDNLGNTILAVDSSNNRLTRRIEYKYEDSLKVSSSEFSHLDSSWDPTTSEKSYFYKNGRLVKTIEKEKGDDLIGLLSEEDERTYYELFEYENGLVTLEIRLTDNDTLSVTSNSYNNMNNIVKAVSEGPTGDIGLSTWEYDNQGNLTAEFTQYANLTQRIEYSYDSLNRLTKKLTYLKQ